MIVKVLICYQTLTQPATKFYKVWMTTDEFKLMKRFDIIELKSYLAGRTPVKAPFTLSGDFHVFHFLDEEA